MTGTAFPFRPVHHVQLAIPAGGEERCRTFRGEVLGMRQRSCTADPFGNRLQLLKPHDG